MEDSKITNGNCWVAYFDILGFSNMVESFPVFFVLELYQKALQDSGTSNTNCKFKFFSDSFIFYTENDSQDSLCDISAVTAIFFRGMFLKEYPMRGCLNIGQFYADEENGIFFGPALIEAHHLAEDQNWIGFVFSEETGKKFECFELTGFKSTIRLRHQKYEVPYKKEPKRRCLFAYNLNLLTAHLNTGSARYFQNRLRIALDDMEYKACLMFRKATGNKNIDINKCPEYRKIITKYKNTKKFLLHVSSALKEREKQK